MLAQTAKLDGRNVKGSIPQDPGSAGKVVAQGYIRLLRGYPYFASTETGDKESRALPLAAQVEVGNVYLVNGPWVRAFLDEVEMFPNAKFKDRVDAASRAFEALTTAPTGALKGSY